MDPALYIIGSPEGAFQFAGTTQNGRLFRKELLREGEYQHPIRPWKQPLRATLAYLETVAVNSNAAIAAGVKIPVPDGHNDDAKDNAGFAVRFEVAPSESVPAVKALYSVVEITDPKYQEKVGRDIRDISVFLADFGSGTWKCPGDRVIHIALTNYPVASGHSNFVPLSLGSGVSSNRTNVPVLLSLGTQDPENEPMKIPAAIRALAVKWGLTVAEDAEFTDAFATEFAAKAPVPVAPVTPPALTEADAPKCLSVDAKTQRYFGEARKHRADAIKAKIEAASKEGKLTADMKAQFEALLGVDYAYTLSTEGAAVATNVVEAVEKILASIPANSIVPLQATTVEKPKNDPDPMSPEAAKAEADRVLSLIGQKS